MPKNRHLTYSDQQSQTAHETRMKKLQALMKKSATPLEPAAAPAAKKKAVKKKAGTKM